METRKKKLPKKTKKSTKKNKMMMTKMLIPTTSQMKNWTRTPPLLKILPERRRLKWESRTSWMLFKTRLKTHRTRKKNLSLKSGRRRKS